MTKESIYELEKIDCNCNECVFMVRDIVKFKIWEQWNKELQESDFIKRKAKAIADAKEAILKAANDADRKSCEGILFKANKMKFQFNRDGLISYGNCTKFNKAVSFLPGICQVETQECFKHRRSLGSYEAVNSASS